MTGTTARGSAPDQRPVSASTTSGVGAADGESADGGGHGGALQVLGFVAAPSHPVLEGSAQTDCTAALQAALLVQWTRAE